MRFAIATADALAGHPGTWGWDLGNENSNRTIPTGWADGRKLARTIGLHLEDLEDDRLIGPAEAARWCDIVSMQTLPRLVRRYRNVPSTRRNR